MNWPLMSRLKRGGIRSRAIRTPMSFNWTFRLALYLTRMSTKFFKSVNNYNTHVIMPPYIININVLKIVTTSRSWRQIWFPWEANLPPWSGLCKYYGLNKASTHFSSLECWATVFPVQRIPGHPVTTGGVLEPSLEAHSRANWHPFDIDSWQSPGLAMWL